MKSPKTEIEYRRLTTPRAAAIAGILFGLLFSASLARHLHLSEEVIDHGKSQC